MLQASDSLRGLATDRRVLVSSLTWASLNWLLDAASLWCFIAAFGHFTDPVGLFAAYGIANVLGAIPISPAGLGVIDSLTPVLLVSFGLTRSVAILGVLAWRLVNFWLPIPAGAASYVALKVPRGSGWAATRQAVTDLVRRDRPDAEPRAGPGDRAGRGAPPGRRGRAGPAGSPRRNQTRQGRGPGGPGSGNGGWVWRRAAVQATARWPAGSGSSRIRCRRKPRAWASSRDTCIWDMPRWRPISAWVMSP